MVTQQVPIQGLPNQQFSITLDNNIWDFSIKATNGVMSVSLGLNGGQVIENMRAVAGMRLIPSRYEEAGNFVFYTQNFDLPDYTQFNISQSLIYYSAAELAVIRNPVRPPITASYFNGIAALPLRFRPQGY
jgi:hypothetical protein